MPHNFYSLPATSPNPGRWNRGQAQQVCQQHGAQLDGFWFDHPNNPTTAYVLAKDGDAEAIKSALHATQMTPLYEGS